MFSFLGFLTSYVLLIPILGYMLASLIYMPGVLWLLKYRRPVAVGVLTLSWLAFSYVVFQRTLYVDLPAGMLLRQLNLA
jgi:hypothetical protein